LIWYTPRLTSSGYVDQRFPWSPPVVGLGGVEPPTSSLSAKCREPLCGPPFLQVALDRKGQRYALNQPIGMRSYVHDDGRRGDLSLPDASLAYWHPYSALHCHLPAHLSSTNLTARPHRYRLATRPTPTLPSYRCHSSRIIRIQHSRAARCAPGTEPRQSGGMSELDVDGVTLQVALLGCQIYA
jgi:hypothetical protein